MTKRQRLYAEHGQSPWLDNLTRGYLSDRTLARMVADGSRGVTANPATIDAAWALPQRVDQPNGLTAKAHQPTRR